MARRRYKLRYYIGTRPIAKFCTDLFMRKFKGEITQEQLDAELDRGIPLTENLFNFGNPQDTLNEGRCLANADRPCLPAGRQR
jgi:hypothetical protein